MVLILLLIVIRMISLIIILKVRPVFRWPRHHGNQRIRESRRSAPARPRMQAAGLQCLKLQIAIAPEGVVQLAGLPLAGVLVLLMVSIVIINSSSFNVIRYYYYYYYHHCLPPRAFAKRREPLRPLCSLAGDPLSFPRATDLACPAELP